MRQQAKNRDISTSSSQPTFIENDPTYVEWKAKRFLREYAKGMTLAQICSDPKMPSVRYLWEWRKMEPWFADEWDKIKGENQASARNSKSEFQVAVAEEILSEYGTTSTSLRAILERSDDYPGMTAFHKWSKNNPIVREMRVSAEEARSVILAEEAMERADQLDDDDPRAVTLQVRTRHWLAERFWRAKFGPQQVVSADEDDLVNRSEKEAIDVLRGLTKELEAVGITLHEHVH